MPAANLDRASMRDILARWGYVNPDAILREVDKQGEWSDKVAKRTTRMIISQGSGWYVMYVE